MNVKSDGSTEIGYIIPDNIQWGLGQIDEMPTTIFDKDLMSSSPEHSQQILLHARQKLNIKQ
jgi:hypothetical protein